MVAPLSHPHVSVVVPARNVAGFLAATLESVTSQTERDFELLLIDDGSTDATADVARAHAARDPRVRLLAGPQRGVSAARNLGLAAARGELVLFLDADDILRPDALSRFRCLMSRTPAAAVLGGIARIAEDGSPLPGNDNRALVSGPDHLSQLLCKNFVVNGGALMIRRSAAVECGGFDETLAYGEDWEFWCRLAEIGDFALMPGEPVLLYRQRASGANNRARGSIFARNVPCLRRVSDRPSLRRRLGGRLPRLLRARQIDIFWSGVRSEFQFGARGRALLIALGGLLLYPDSFARPQLAVRFFKSLQR